MNFLLLAIYISLYYIRPFEWATGFIGEPFLVITGVCALVAIVLHALSGKTPNIITGDVERMMLFFWVAICLSQISQAYLTGLIKSFTVFQPTLVGFFLILTSVNNRKQLKWFMLLLIALTSFVAYEGILQYTTGFAHGGMEPLYQVIRSLDGGIDGRLARTRWYGVFNDPNDLGMLFVIVIPFLIDMVMRRHFLMPLICLPLITTALYYTHSRGSILAGLISIGGYFVIRYRSMRGLVFGIVLAATVLAFAPGRMTADEESAHGRIDSWYAGYQMFKDNPLFGVGQGNFTDFNDLTAHNSFVLVMSETGFFGLFCFIGLIYHPLYWLYTAVLKAKKNKYTVSDQGIISAVYGSFFGVLGAMFFLSRSYVLVPFILISLSVVVSRIIKPEYEIGGAGVTIAPNHMMNIFLITLSQIIFIFVFVKIFI